jgi:class 3 adenylate cyclase
MQYVVFGQQVKAFLKAAGFSQKILARNLGLNQSVLTHKLNGTGRTILTYPEIRQIVKSLADLEAITYRAEAQELLIVAGCPGFSDKDWEVNPLKKLTVEKGPGYFLNQGLPLLPDLKELHHTKALSPALNGIATFLFTDIEGSTAHWERQPEIMHKDLARHDRLIRQVILDKGGTVFKAMGDGFLAVFPTTLQALAAAIQTQQDLLDLEWSLETPLKVRMALHSGQAQERDGDYFGLVINRGDRILATGHGGQILLSLVSTELVRDHLPANVHLRELGQFYLKDLTRPEFIFQVVATGLPENFPQLNSMESGLNNLQTELLIRSLETVDQNSTRSTPVKALSRT